MTYGSPWLCEAEVVEGLEDIAVSELNRRLGADFELSLSSKGLVQFTYNGRLQDLLSLRSVIAVHLLYRFQVPRPKALLGHQNFQFLLDMIASVQRIHPHSSFHTLSIDAAGSDSSVMQRLKQELANAVGLQASGEKGDLLLRLRRSLDGKGWDALVRISPRPLVTRNWRTVNYEGALNASVAYAMNHLTRPDPEHIYLNIACGSASLLIERAAYGPGKQVLGLDNDQEALTFAEVNITASGFSEIQLLQADGLRLPLSQRSIHALTADLPFGQLVGSHDDNRVLYPAILKEAARVAVEGSRFVLITHEIRIMEALVKDLSSWRLQEQRKITLRGLHPRIYVLERS
jgi:tRNA (guanine6-N2)-methyltransferase